MSQSRRRFIKQSAGILASGSIISQQKILSLSSEKKRSARIAHLTDIHLEPELNGEREFIKCLHHAQNLDDKPDFILNGGDAIMDALAADQARTKLQWALWHKVLKSDCSLPIEHCLGNHDIWGWNKKSGATGKESFYGKKWALDEYGLTSAFRSFERGNWHVIVLDSMIYDETKGYTATIDETQWGWLLSDIAAVPPSKPIAIITHIPILSVAGFFHVPESSKSGDWIMLGVLMHLDAERFISLFQKYKNIKLCISGHIHLVDRIQYDNVTFLCNGAVCGKWWKGAFHETEPGYALIDLFDDGSFEQQYIPYGWSATN